MIEKKEKRRLIEHEKEEPMRWGAVHKKKKNENELKIGGGVVIIVVAVRG